MKTVVWLEVSPVPSNILSRAMSRIFLLVFGQWVPKSYHSSHSFINLQILCQQCGCWELCNTDRMSSVGQIYLHTQECRLCIWPSRELVKHKAQSEVKAHAMGCMLQRRPGRAVTSQVPCSRARQPLYTVNVNLSMSTSTKAQNK